MYLKQGKIAPGWGLSQILPNAKLPANRDLALKKPAMETPKDSKP